MNYFFTFSEYLIEFFEIKRNLPRKRKNSKIFMSTEIGSFNIRQLYNQPPIGTNFSHGISPLISPLSNFDQILNNFGPISSSTSTDFLFSIFGNEFDLRRHSSIQQILTHRINSNYNFEYLIKLIGKSYRNCIWVTENFIIQSGGQAKLKEYRKKNLVPPDPPYYDPDFEKIEKILCKRNDNEYLVKWCNLEYEQSTWETAESIKDNNLIGNFLREQILPTKEELKIPPRPPPSMWRKIADIPFSKSGFQARNYQIEGLNFLNNCWYNNRNCILADEMGLGKTLQSILFLNLLRNKEKIRGPFLIIAPLSTIPQWTREITEWSTFKPLVFTGEQIKRTMMKMFEFFYEDTKIPKFEVLLTTYETVLRDNDLSTIQWECMIIDEAHRLKNSESKLLKVIRSYQSSFKILLTGTPIQNKAQELWSLLNFLDPLNYNSLGEFERKYGNCNEVKAVQDLQNILKPIMLRRLKSDVEKGIAPMEEVIIDCPMTMHQKAYYNAVFLKNIEYLTRGAHSKTSNTCLRNISMDLRKVCNHPYLLKKAEEQILIERREAMKNDNTNDNTFVNESLIRSSGKMILLDKLLTKLKADGHRVLIFSQMQMMLDILCDYLIYKQYKFRRIDGSVRSKERQDAIDNFNHPDSKDFVFLLCTKAGGVGINLTSADTVIIYDSDWNPQNDIQATARCHRIGQTKEVKVYRFITANSYERKMFETASMKLGLDHAVLESSKIHNQEDMDKLIRLGAYHALEDDNAEIEKFGEEDIEMIISRSQRIKHENINGESTFSKAEFKIEDESVPVALYKPEFWKKYVPEVEKYGQYVHYDDDYSDSFSSKEKKSNSHFDLLDYVFESDEEDNQLKADPEYWNKERIQLLICQLVRFGFNKWEEVISSANFTCEKSEVKAVSRVILGWFLTNSTEEEDVILQKLYDELASKITSNFEKKFIKMKKNELKSLFIEDDNNSKLKRIELLYCIEKLVETCPSVPEEIVIPEMDKNGPAKWWMKKHDQQLLQYVSMTGLQLLDSFELNDHPGETFSKKILLGRMNQIISKLIEVYQQYRNNHKNEDPTFSHDILSKAVCFWSPKDQKTIIRFLCLFGYPNAKQFKFVSGLRNKTEEMIDAFVHDILIYCHSVHSISKTQKSKMGSEVTESDEESTSFDSTSNDMSSDLFAVPFNESNSLVVEPITLNTSSRILARCKFFEKVREFQNTEISISEKERNLVKYIAERGFLNPSESQAIRAAFGEIPSDTKVIKRIENMDRNFFGKKPHRSNPSEKVGEKEESSEKVHSISNEPLPANSTICVSDKYEIQTNENGDVIFPISLSSSLVLVSLGKIVYDRPNFHTKKYIYSPGFISEHLYSNINNPKEKVWYQSLIIDNGSSSPVFRVQLKEDPSIFFDGNSPSNPWLTLFKKINEKRENKSKPSAMVTVSGPEFYGLSHPITQFLMRKLENVEKCENIEFSRIFSTIKAKAPTKKDKNEKLRNIHTKYKDDESEDKEEDEEEGFNRFRSESDNEKRERKRTNDKKAKNSKIQRSSTTLRQQQPANKSIKVIKTEKYNAPIPLLLDFGDMISKARAMSREEDEIFSLYGYQI